MSRPLIGITADMKKVKATTGLEPAHALWPAYTKAVRAAGGIPVILTPGDVAEATATLDRIDGLLLSGGGDVDPSEYQGTHRPRVYGIDPDRDLSELALARLAEAQRFPTLCICRGLQVMNVALGGTLIEDIVDEDQGHHEHFLDGDAAFEPQHDVQVEPGSRLAKIYDAEVIRANSIHHQSIRTPADRLVVTGRSPDGVIEAVEPADEDWPMVAVQWHPELLADDPGSQRLFADFVDASR